MLILKIKILNKKEQEQYDDFIKYYKFVLRCKKCGNLFGVDKLTEKMCIFCDKKYLSCKGDKIFKHWHIQKDDKN